MSEDNRFIAEVVTDISDIDAESWNNCAGQNPFLKHAFMLALEQSGCATAETGWQPLHIKVSSADTGKALAFMPLYVKSHSYGEYVFDHAWANAFERAGGRYYPKLQSSVPFTPVTGNRLLLSSDAPAGIERLVLQTAARLVSERGLSSLHITFLPSEEADLAKREGYLIRTDQQFHWQNDSYSSFEHFLEKLSSRKRKQIRKERKTAQSTGIEIEVIEGQDIDPHHWDAFFAFYLDTGAKKWGHPYLNRFFFDLISSSMPEHIVLMLCRKNDSYIAGALNFKGGDTLYGRYWGCIEDHPCLHFETCYYQAIEYAITNRLSTVEAGAQGAHKLARGYVPTHTYSAHWIENDSFKDAIAQYLCAEKESVAAEVEYLTSKAPFKKG